MSNGPTFSHKKNKKKRKKSKGSIQQASLSPSSFTHKSQIEIVEQGEEAIEIINVGEFVTCNEKRQG